ncbi:hypothetical protein ACLEIY_06590 [Acetobacter tropicalis]|uniref:hypothetical protein n=1 Tax=Acetobacter tropicalis TaxID=104102 RepID=UPI003974E92E
MGKKANYQALVSVIPTAREVPPILSLSLFLSDIWTADPACMKRAGVPLEHQGAPDQT